MRWGAGSLTRDESQARSSVSGGVLVCRDLHVIPLLCGDHLARVLIVSLAVTCSVAVGNGILQVGVPRVLAESPRTGASLWTQNGGCLPDGAANTVLNVRGASIPRVVGCLRQWSLV